MMMKILSISGMKQLSRTEQRKISGGSPCDPLAPPAECRYDTEQWDPGICQCIPIGW